ncbi:MAG TPA: hypothetical protein VIY28_13730 [Pseudonocardiaceae bacterium]
MGMTAAPPASGALAQAFRWHRPLMILAAAMAGLVVVGIAGMFADSRVLTGLPIWDKPTKFALSVLIYSITWAWLIAQLGRARRAAWWAGTASAVFLGIEMVIIVGQVVRGTTSHFNVSTPFNATLWYVMAGSIALVWVATLLVSLILFRNLGPDRARNLAVRAGTIVAVIGMALGYLMTIPTADQITHGGSILGAHTVGLPDGGPGLPILGWSTAGGDLRIPHFVGMHALQLIPLLAIALELLRRRIRVLRTPTVRFRLIGVATAGYVGLLALVTWQALRAQSIVHPDALTAAALALIIAGVITGAAVTLRAGATDSALAGAREIT